MGRVKHIYLPTLCLDVDAHMARTAMGAMRLTGSEMHLLVPLLSNGNHAAAYSTYVRRWDDMTASERHEQASRIRATAGHLRIKLRKIGIDVVTIACHGFRLDEFSGGRARVEYPEGKGFPARLKAPPAPVRAELSDYDRQRIRNLHHRGYTAMGIAGIVRKPHAKIDEVLRAAR